MSEDGRKPEKVQIRCSEKTLAQWKRTEAEIAPFGDMEEALKKLMDTYERNPGMFERETV